MLPTRSPRQFLVVLLVALCGALLAPATGAATPRYFGFSDGSAIGSSTISPELHAGASANAGANAKRTTLDWRQVEPVAGSYRWAAYDAVYNAALARGIRMVWAVSYAPRWAWDPGTICAGECRYPPANAHLGSWRRLIARIAARYPASAGIEVWNEPNLRGYWHSGPDAYRYTRLLTHADAGVRDAGSTIPVIGGALSNNQANANGSLSLATFLGRMYIAGARPAMDAISVHAYPWSLDLGSTSLFAKSLSQVRTARDAAGDAGKPIWITEIGLSTTGSNPLHRFTEAQQASGLVAQYRAASAQPDIEAHFVHTLFETTGSTSSIEPGYGVVRRNLVPKAAFCALRYERLRVTC